MAADCRPRSLYTLAPGEGERAGVGDGVGSGLDGLGAKVHDDAMLTCRQDGDDTATGVGPRGQLRHDGVEQGGDVEDGLLTSPSDTRVTTGISMSG